MTIEEVGYFIGLVLSALLFLAAALVLVAEILARQFSLDVLFCMLSLLGLKYFTARLEQLKGKRP